jgi:hypothetical protein
MTYQGQRNVITDTKVSEQCIEHQSSMLWETPSQPSWQSQCDEDGGKKWLEARIGWSQCDEDGGKKWLVARSD